MNKWVSGCGKGVCTHWLACNNLEGQYYKKYFHYVISVFKLQINEHLIFETNPVSKYKRNCFPTQLKHKSPQFTFKSEFMCEIFAIVISSISIGMRTLIYIKHNFQLSLAFK